jgi:sulfur carrier protein
MIVKVNGEAVPVDDHATVATVLDRLGFKDRGVAVALDWAMLPRARWETTLSDGARLEVVTATQGG